MLFLKRKVSDLLYLRETARAAQKQELPRAATSVTGLLIGPGAFLNLGSAQQPFTDFLQAGVGTGGK